VRRSEIAKAADPAKARAEFVADYREKFANPYKAAELGFIDEVIYPRTLRTRLHSALELLKDKRDTNPPKKHTNIPL
jgi:propionyl-CoA carboxylase beta chain